MEAAVAQLLHRQLLALVVREQVAAVDEAVQGRRRRRRVRDAQQVVAEPEVVRPHVRQVVPGLAPGALAADDQVVARRRGAVAEDERPVVGDSLQPPAPADRPRRQRLGEHPAEVGPVDFGPLARAGLAAPMLEQDGAILVCPRVGVPFVASQALELVKQPRILQSSQPCLGVQIQRSSLLQSPVSA